MDFIKKQKTEQTLDKYLAEILAGPDLTPEAWSISRRTIYPTEPHRMI
jgi:hypothetical protein